MSNRKRHCYICDAVDSYTKTFEGTGVSRYGVLCAECMGELREKQAALALERERKQPAKAKLTLVPQVDQQEAR
jgi:hypothetical protein